MRIVQLLPTIVNGDAVSSGAVAVGRLLKRWDRGTKIYAVNIGPGVDGSMVRPASELPALSGDDVLIYHMSVGDELRLRIDELDCRKVMIYHNVTPPEFYEPYSRDFTRLCRKGCREMARMKDWFDYVIAVSDYNRQGLLEAGYTCPIDVCPLLVSMDDYRSEPDRRTMEKYADGRTNILFVGRVVPNKRFENVIRAFACYQERYDPDARLILAGSDSVEPYSARLRAYIRALGVRNVKMTGHVSFPELLAFYRRADALLCMSEHEGFCVPLLEAMFFDLPVVALDAAAVGETLGGSGILLSDSDPALCAGVLNRLREDEALRAAVIAGERRRLEELSPDRVARQFEELFAAFLAAPRREAKPRTVQLLNSVGTGETSQTAFALRAELERRGCREEIWTLECADELLRSELRCSPKSPLLREKDGVLLHYTGRNASSEAFSLLRCRKTVLFCDLSGADGAEPEQLKRLVSAADRCIVRRESDRRLLKELGARDVRCLSRESAEVGEKEESTLCELLLAD